MTPADRLAALQGTWRTLRVIRHADGMRARFAGETRWDGGRCIEAGTLSQGGHDLQAHRTTHWQATPTVLRVDFVDGRPFHDVPSIGGTAHHDCPPDTYVLTYDFSAWPCWSIRWRVTGPRKAYRALTRYVRISP